MRDYESEPRPNLEWHPHIRELIEAQEKRAADRELHKDKIKQRHDRENDIAVAPAKETKPFYCETCKEDFLGEALKQVEVDWSNTAQSIAFYKTKCFKGHWCSRLITDKLTDRYFYKSLRVAVDRGKAFADILQPFQTNYNLLYGKK